MEEEGIVDSPLLGKRGEDALDLGRECEAIRPLQVMKGFLSEAIPREEQAPPRSVPKREGPHSVEAADTIGPPLAVREKDDFGVRLRPEDVAERTQLVGEFAVVVNLAVVRDA